MLSGGASKPLPLFLQLTNASLRAERKVNFYMTKIILKGLGVSAGLVKARVKIITSDNDAVNFTAGEILVTRITDPTMVMMMSRAAAIVTDIGGMTSHPAIVSREMGIPCIVATKTATKDLTDGMDIIVDGSSGEVMIEEDFETNVETSMGKDCENLIKAYRAAFATMDSDTFQGATDYSVMDPLIAKCWTDKVLGIIREAKKRNLSSLEVADLLHTPTAIRSLAFFDLFMSSICKRSKEQKREIAKFYIDALKEKCVEDPFCLEGKNKIHDDKEIDNLSINLKKADQSVAKSLGRLVNACYHMGYSLFGDMNPQLVYENYGPYSTAKDGHEYLMVVKEYKNMKPIEFWPETSKLPIEKIKIVCLYENVKFSIDAITHTNYEGDVVNGLKYYAVYVNGEMVDVSEVERVTALLERYSSFLWHIFKTFDEKQFKKIYVYQKAFNYSNLCDRLGLDWRPEKEIVDEMLNKPLKKWPDFKSAKERDEYMLKIVDPATEFSGE